ncbi:sugar synthetase [Desulfoplanes formicivorans]|uniref:Lipid-A-disaccharide synthase n=1 Tax=Desulfoplanes formicivorans TaxID=1592317 RepID=A0A194AKM5_9BACT|nr:sugar synthetase [Desulfoplanes formicivorans]
MKKVFICAGEASGDMYGAMLVDALHAIDPALSCVGMGGSTMRARGFKALIHSEALSVMGLTEVIGHLPRILGLFTRMRRFLEKERPAVVVLIDSPDFNFRVAKMAKKLSIPVVYYITPQVWAWRQGRVKFLKHYVDRLVCIFPFEEPFFRKHGLDATFVGHPLLETMDLATRRKIGPDAKRIGILPGSRHKEIASLLPVFAKVASLLWARDPALRFTLVQAPQVELQTIQSLWLQDVPVDIVPATDRYDALRQCSFVVAASGTATFECALLGVPTMLAYKVAFLSYHIGRRLIRVPFIGMVNLILGKRVFPEFIQHEATPQAMAALGQSWLEHPDRLELIRSELETLPAMMGPGKATDRAAAIVAEYVSGTR